MYIKVICKIQKSMQDTIAKISLLIIKDLWTKLQELSDFW